jgi:NADPH2:quinone reductase
LAAAGSILAFTFWSITEEKKERFTPVLFADLDSGTPSPIVGKELPLAEAPAPNKEILEPGTFGKIVLVA